MTYDTSVASGDDTFAGKVAQSAGDDWKMTPPLSLGLDEAILNALGQRLLSLPSTNIHSILVIRNGALAYEQYFSGEDEKWGEPLGRVGFDESIFHDLRSATKSVSALLVGIAVDRQIIPSIDEPVFSFFPEYSDLRTPGKERILLSHLLTMSAGLEWDQYRPVADPKNSEARMIRAADPYRYVLERPIVAPPGKKWTYSSGATELLGAVVSRAADRTISSFAQEVLFEPLGITTSEWTCFSSNNIPSAASGLRLRPRDMAKLGQLVLARGRWGDRQIVSESWVEDSTTPKIGGPEIYFYGYHWMLGRSLVHRRETTWVSAAGQGGQRIFIVPALKLVVVITAGLYTSAIQYQLPLEILNHHIFAAVKD